MDVKTVSDGHDGSFCLLRNGKVEKHFAAERVSHIKHDKICEVVSIIRCLKEHRKTCKRSI